MKGPPTTLARPVTGGAAPEVVPPDKVAREAAPAPPGSTTGGSTGTAGTGTAGSGHRSQRVDDRTRRLRGHNLGERHRGFCCWERRQRRRRSRSRCQRTRCATEGCRGRRGRGLERRRRKERSGKRRGPGEHLQVRQRAQCRVGELRERRPQPQHRNFQDDLQKHLRLGRAHRPLVVSHQRQRHARLRQQRQGQ